MAQRKARKRGRSAKGARVRRKRPARLRKAAPRPAAGAAARKRIGELEAENRRLRDEIERLRAERIAPAPREEAGEGPPALEF
jgi:hypothetical protein